MHKSKSIYNMGGGWQYNLDFVKNKIGLPKAKPVSEKYNKYRNNIY